MRRLVVPLIMVLTGLWTGGSAFGEDGQGPDRKRLIEEIDKRIDAKLKQFRRELMGDLKELLAGKKGGEASEKRESGKDGERTRKVETRIMKVGKSKADGEGHAELWVEENPGKSGPGRRIIEGRVDAGKPKGKIRVRIESDGKVWEKEFDAGDGHFPFEFELPGGGDMPKILKRILPHVEQFGKEFGPGMEKFGREFGKKFKDMKPEEFAKMFKGMKGPGGMPENFRKWFGGGGRMREWMKGRMERDDSEDEEECEEDGEDEEDEAWEFGVPGGGSRGMGKRFVKEFRVEPGNPPRKSAPDRGASGGRDKGRGDREIDKLSREREELERELKELRKLLERLKDRRDRGKDGDF